MSGTTQNACDVIILGGGVAGASSAMQLALRGLRVVVLERAMLGSGSTGRAAGLLGQLRSTHAATQMLRDGIEIVSDLQSRTGSQIFVQTGSLRVASTEDRAAEIRAHVALGREVGLDVDHIERSEVRRMLPYMKADDLLDACYCPTDGHLQPAELLAAYVQVARQYGVRFQTNAKVQRAYIEQGEIRGVRAAEVDYWAPVVLNATGPWSYVVADALGSRLPTAALGHYYLTTTPQGDQPIDRQSPAVRDRELRIYSRPEAGGLIVGMYESEPVEYDTETLPDDFDMSQMRAARDQYQVALLIEAASQRFPFITPRTPMRITTGIMTFTPDGQPFCGRDGEIGGLYHCTGFCGHGIVQSPAIGLIMAELIVDGRCRYDLTQIEADRFFDIPELKARPEVKRRCYETYAGYYGKISLRDGQK